MRGERTSRLGAALAVAACASLSARAAEPDTARVSDLHEVVVRAVKAAPTAPFAVSRVGAAELSGFARAGRELPFLLARTPGALAWSENGLGTGTTYMRLRGADGSRVNVTLDGVALNSPEDQCVFWANTGGYASLLGGAQVQRGVGSSTNGDGAFGGSVALQTKAPAADPEGELTASGGSYGTWRAGGSFTTGLNGLGLKRGSLVLEGAWHHTATDGYVHGTGGRNGSYYGALTYVNAAGTLKASYKCVGNYEKTGQAWNGVTAGSDNYSLNAYDGVDSYKRMCDMGLGRYNSLFEHFLEYADEDWNYHMERGADGRYKTVRHTMADGSLWPGATDYFRQSHHLLSVAAALGGGWTLSGTLHYTAGHGWYDEFRYDNKLRKFGLANFPLSSGGTLKRTDFVRRKGLTQDTYGAVWSAGYKRGRWDAVAGGALQQFEGGHYGYLTYIANEELRASVLRGGRYQYYESGARKSDASLFVKGTYSLTSSWDVYGDLQYRHVGYLTGGVNDKFLALEDGTYANQRLDVDKRYDFLNPKAGLSYHRGGHSAYVSYALSHREPGRDNFTDNGSWPAPVAESAHDMELGYSFRGAGWHAGLGMYAMLYHNQFAQTGAKSDIGEDLTTNVRRSYRLGLELEAGVDVAKWLSVSGNAALSRNRIKDFDEVVETYDDYWGDADPTVVHYSGSTLAFSPSAILNGFADFRLGGVTATWHTGFVSRQFMDNSACQQRSLPSYSVSDVSLSYELGSKRRGGPRAVLGLDLGNVFNKRYAASGWVYSAIVGDKYPEGARYSQTGYVPMAGFTAMGSLTLKF